jgi:hypothetical protein
MKKIDSSIIFLLVVHYQIIQVRFVHNPALVLKAYIVTMEIAVSRFILQIINLVTKLFF